MFELSDLRAFTRVADLGGVSVAARALRMPKSSVSRSLARLEAALGVILVERSSRSLRLTEAGLLFRPYALRILGDVDEAEASLGSFAGQPRGTLRVNAPAAFAQVVLAPMLPAFLTCYPELRVALEVENRRIDVLAEDVDVVIRTGDLSDSALIARRLARMELWVCASPGYLAARGAPTDLLDLAGHDVVGWFGDPNVWPSDGSAAAAQAVNLVARADVRDPVVRLALVAGGAGISCLPDFFVAEAVAKGRLVRMFAERQSQTVDVHALYPSHHSLSAKVRVFIDALVAHLKFVRATSHAAPPDERAEDAPAPAPLD